MNRALWPLLSGFTLWAVAFLALYGLQALGCVWAWDAGLHRTLLVCLYLATLLALGGLLWTQRNGAGTLVQMGRVATVAALVASAVTYVPVTFTSICI